MVLGPHPHTHGFGGRPPPPAIIFDTLSNGVTVAFTVTGREESAIPVRFTGILPDLFVEGSGVVAEGRLGADGTFIADNLLAKHDENYMPRELEGMSEGQAAEMAEETTVGLQ